MGKGNPKAQKADNIIPLVLDAQFYYQKAIQAMNKKNYALALRYFRRTVELEPDNPVNHCNLAGMLAEMGQFDESNQILLYVLEHLSPDFHECTLFLGHNYASLGEYPKARDYALLYMKEEPDGAYAQEAEELLAYLSEMMAEDFEGELDGKEEAVLSPHALKHEEAKQQLEKGHYKRALKKLKKLIVQYPDYLPARNNLALTYYHLGQIEAAIEETERILAIEPANLHALCNLAVFTQGTERSEAIAEGLEKVLPYRKEEGYTLATVFGMLKKDEAAYRQLLHIYRMHGENPLLLHLLAVSAYNRGEIDLAAYWWRRIRNEASNLIAGYYLDKRDESGEREKERIQFYYSQHLIDEEVGWKTAASQEDSPANPSDLVDIKAAVLKSLMAGDDDRTPIELYQLLEKVSLEELIDLFRQLLNEPEVSAPFKAILLSALMSLKVTLPITMELEGVRFRIEEPAEYEDLPQRVLLIAKIAALLQEESESFSPKEKEMTQDWLFSLFFHKEFITYTVRTRSAFLAALDYWLKQQQGIKLRKGEQAKRYGISPSTLNRYLQLFFEY